MPAKSAAQYGAMLAAAKGKGKKGISRKVAKKYIAETSAAKRSAFAKSLARKRKKKR